MRTVVSMLTLAAAMSAAAPFAFAQPGGGGPQLPDSIGTGPFPALKEVDASLPDQVVYRPADLSALGSTKLGVYVFGNGACSDDAASSRQHLLEIASHGYLAIAPGGIYSGPGATPRAAPAGQRNPADDAPTRPEQLRAAIDWALAENARPGSPYYNRIDTNAIAASGFSCGGIQALVIADDPRLKTVVVMNSGLFKEGETRMGGMTVPKEQLMALHFPTLYVLGGPTDIAYENGMDDYAKIEHVPVAVANIDKGHGGTYAEPNGGAAAAVVVDWLEWQLRGDAEAARTFLGDDCGLCVDPEWTYEKKGFDAAPRTAAAALPEACSQLTALAAAGFRVDTAEWVEAASPAAGRRGGGPGGPGGPGGRGGAGPGQATPAHCLFRATLNARPSSIDGVSLGLGFELRLPRDWNGRFLFQGGGGLNGTLNAAMGNVSGAPSALARGFAVVSTDSGHRGRSMVDSSFAADQQAKLDFAYQAVARTTLEAKDIVESFYGQSPEYSYFMGCSTGGREGMMAAQRLPLEFDGVVSGDPAFNLTRIAANQVYSLQTVARIAPRGADGALDFSAAFSDAQLRAVADAVTAQCDALDGLADGMINDFEACDFDPASLTCPAGSSPADGQCLDPAQAQALKDIYGGAKNSRGESLYGPFPFDTGIANPAWRSMHLGSAGRPPANAGLGADTLRLFAMTPAQPDLDPLAFDFDRDMALTVETAAINDAVGTLHSTFAGRGGKLIVYHGLSDQGMSAGALTEWYAKLTPRDEDGPQDWARMFFVPGMMHCSGGQATDTFDLLTAIQSWVEDGEAPDRVVASGNAFPGVTRPLCPYPQVARYDGGDPASADSFSCR